MSSSFRVSVACGALLLAGLVNSSAGHAKTKAAQPAADTIVAVPFGTEVAERAVSDAVVAALPIAARDRGLQSKDTRSVAAVARALARCSTDACRVTQAQRLKARYVVTGVAAAGGVELRLADAQGAVLATQVLSGALPAQLSGAVGAVDALVESVAPRHGFAKRTALIAAQDARKRGDIDAADAALSGAVELAPFDDAVARLWLMRLRLLDEAAPRERAAAAWDALEERFQKQPAVDALVAAPLVAALRDHLQARASFLVARAATEAGADQTALLLEAARCFDRVAAGADAAGRSTATLQAAELYLQAGDAARARTAYQAVIDDAQAPERERLDATVGLARLRADG